MQASFDDLELEKQNGSNQNVLSRLLANVKRIQPAPLVLATYSGIGCLKQPCTSEHGAWRRNATMCKLKLFSK